MNNSINGFVHYFISAVYFVKLNFNKRIAEKKGIKNMYKILVADDEQKIREVIKEYAEYEGHTVYEAVDGMQAVDMAKEQDFDIIIMDVMMPRLDGFSACKEIRKFKNTLYLCFRQEQRNMTSCSALRWALTIMW